MSRARIRNAALIPLLVVTTAACVRLGHIQQTVPIRTTYFSGSPKTVAHCIHQRLGGKARQELFADDRYVIYDSVKGKQRPGLTHYAITIGKDAADHGFVELRIAPGGPGLGDGSVREYWSPVVDCVEQLKT